jgi:hypothetical protein
LAAGRCDLLYDAGMGQETMNAHLGPQEYLQKLRQTEEMVEIEPDEESIRQLSAITRSCEN